uniref:DUF4276 family protein n=1 Tax=Candidatus Kentrum eta TaxID=2126337 RepID=A0A450U947_9GAMM|nr:MAG: hypothetical protein BECKH772A_GA0070896_1000930 [Candidatus Kentron sp. H]VFJ90614.1 MAG: hypothetical protein BECKH772B_GA0070898_1001030 [Candidatus Kentron sp. H]VFJ96767.1 MAG: hypothetical protein BECKH772C_GA0070978_1000830 [Candidatus Kentron sp. H]
MRNLAIFTEGRTEQIFAEKLVLFLAGGANVAVRVERVEGGRREPRRIVEIAGTGEPEGHEFFVLIIDCGQDERVKSDIRDRYKGLIEAGYQHIVGIRDLRPFKREDAHRVRQGFSFGWPNGPIKPALILAIMEIEAWFLAEYSHFSRVHEAITVERIRREFGFDPASDHMQLRERPAKDLEDIYFLEAIPYHKTREQVERTVSSLDFSLIRNHVATRIADLGKLVRLIEAFFEARGRANHVV